jgi:hypothetical protein
VRLLTKLIDKCLESLTYRSGAFITYTIKRINLDSNISVGRNQNPFNENLAIVLQGPVSKFTQMACSYYLHSYEDLTVILSTWKQEDISKLSELLTNKRFHLIESEKPNFEGISNINLQITSSLKGLERAKDLKFEYVIKSRTDQILLSKSLLTNLHFIFQSYGKNDSHRNRIVISERNTFISRIYGVSDMFQFGKTEDVFNYWNCELDDRNWEDIDSHESLVNDEEGFARLRLAEVYVATSYLERINHEIDFTIKDSLKCFWQYFVVIDNTKSGLVWNKYGRNTTRLQNQNNKFRELDFLTWLRLKGNIDKIEEELL